MATQAEEMQLRLDQIDDELKSLAREALPHLENLKRITARTAELHKEREKLCWDSVFAFMNPQRQ